MPVSIGASTRFPGGAGYVQLRGGRLQGAATAALGAPRRLDARTGQPLVLVDPRYFRPTEVELLTGDPMKARAKLGWSHKTSFEELVTEMVKSDLRKLQLEPRHHEYPQLRIVSH